MSLLGAPLRRQDPSAARRVELEAWLAEAKADLDRRPNDAEAWIVYARRLAPLYRYREKVAFLDGAIERFPGDFRLLRHRGHRWITLRSFERAIADLERAADLARAVPDAIEPDTLPSAVAPTGSTHHAVWYHLGLARYLSGDFAGAERAYRECLGFSGTAEKLCSTTYWLALSLLRQGKNDAAREAVAPISAAMEVTESRTYRDLCLVMKGELDAAAVLASGNDAPDSTDVPTLGYGVARILAARGESQEAEKLLRRVIAHPHWASFGVIAAEVDLARR